MKAIKDCKWEVQTRRNLFYEREWGWTAICEDDTSDRLLINKPSAAKTNKATKNHWERFAMANGIKKWKYV